jgi:hypothetical protein
VFNKIPDFCFRFPVNDKKPTAGKNDDVERDSDVVDSAVASSPMTSHSAAGCVSRLAVPSTTVTSGGDQTAPAGDRQQQLEQQQQHQQQSSRRAAAIATPMSAEELRKRVEILDEKNAITDMVIRQLGEQIARLQSTSPSAAFASAAVAAAAAAAAATSVPSGTLTVPPPVRNSTRTTGQVRCKT